MAKNESWGIEVGQNAIKAIKLARSGDQVSVVDYEILPFKSVLTTPDLDATEAIQVALDEFVSKQGPGKTPAVISVPGHMAFARFAKLPPVEPKKIPVIVRFEAGQQIPFPMEQVEWDYHVFRDEDSPDVEVGIFAITKDRINRWIDNFEHVSLRLDQVSLSPLAVFNAFRFEDADTPAPGTIYLDIGTVATDVIVVEEGHIWMRTLPMGGNNFTEALMRAFKISFNKAEKLKREAATHKHTRQILVAMRPVFADLVQEVQRSLGYYQSLNRDADIQRIVGLGSTFRLPGLQKFIKQQMQLDVVRPDGFKRLAVDGKHSAEFADSAMNLATAYGLALQGLGISQVKSNLMPNHVLKTRMWKAKQPWIGAAAAVLALGALLVGVKYYADLARFNVSNPDPIQQVLAMGNGLRGNFQEIQTSQGDPNQLIENYWQMIDYQTLWPKLMEDLSRAAAALDPQPEVISSHYERMQQLPRQIWKRLFIDTMTATYVGVTDNAGVPVQPTIAGNAEDSFFPRAQTPFGAPADAPPPAAMGPRFRITITGSTPNRDGASFLQDYFVRWFQHHARQDDRPFTYAIDPNSAIVVFRRRGISANAAQRDRDTPGFTPTRPTPGTSPRRPPTQGGFGNLGGSGHVNYAQFLPQRPDLHVDRSEDNVFTIEWDVILRPRTETRIAEQRGRASAEPASPESVESQPEASPSPEARYQPRDTDLPLGLRPISPSREESAS